MEEFLKHVSLGFLLRSAFGGTFFVLSYQFTTKGAAGLLPGDHPNYLATEVPISLLAGITVYALHRAYSYPIIEWVLDSTRAKSIRDRGGLWALIRDTTVESLYRAWGTGVTAGEKHARYAERLTGWADSTQFNYVAALSTMFGYFAGRMRQTESQEFSFLPFCTIAVFLAAGFTSDWRLKRVREGMPVDSEPSLLTPTDLKAKV